VSQSPVPGPIHRSDLLAIYCNDHLAASTGGIELVERMKRAHRSAPYARNLEQLLDELHEEKAALRSMMKRLDVPVRPHKQLAMWLGEKVSRLKLNGRLLSRSELSDLVEFEFLASAVRAKRSGFETLREVAEIDQRLDKHELDRLIEQANRQHEWLTKTRRDVAASIFGGDGAAPETAAD
jgi:hypothetical protein